VTEAALDARAEARPRRLRATGGARLARELLALLLALLIAACRGAGAARHAPGPSLHRRPDRQGRDRVRPQHPHRPDRRLDLRQVAAQERRVHDSQRHVPDARPRSSSTGRPGAWLYNSLHIDRLARARVRLHRLPRLRPTGRGGPILPGFDIHIGELAIRQLELARGVGHARSGRVRASRDPRRPRDGRASGGIERRRRPLALSLDAEPDRDRFDVDARILSPANGLVPALVGTAARST
jgi:translocation and assembly module TamB